MYSLRYGPAPRPQHRRTRDTVTDSRRTLLTPMESIRRTLRARSFTSHSERPRAFLESRSFSTFVAKNANAANFSWEQERPLIFKLLFKPPQAAPEGALVKNRSGGWNLASQPQIVLAEPFLRKYTPYKSQQRLRCGKASSGSSPFRIEKLELGFFVSVKDSCQNDPTTRSKPRFCRLLVAFWSAKVRLTAVEFAIHPTRPARCSRTNLVVTGMASAPPPAIIDFFDAWSRMKAIGQLRGTVRPRVVQYPEGAPLPRTATIALRRGIWSC